MEEQKSAYLHALLAVVFWSTAASAFKLTLDHLDFIQLLLYSSLFSSLVLLTVLLAQGKAHLLKEYTKRDYMNSAFLGFLNPFLYYFVLFKAYELLPAQEAQPLNFIWPVVLALLSIPLLKQKVKLQSILALFISFFGALVISTHGDLLGMSFSDEGGVALAVGSALIWALFWIYNVRDGRDEVAKLFLSFSFGFLFSLIIAIFTTDITDVSLEGVGGSVYIGIFEMGITFVIWLKALKLSKTAAKVSNLIYGSPFLSLVLIHLVVGEEILPSTVVGLVLIVVGILVQRQGESKEEKNDAEASVVEGTESGG